MLYPDFSFKAGARPIQERARYRDDGDPTKQWCNIAVDPRIYRGTTFSRQKLMTQTLEPIPSYSHYRTISPQKNPEKKFENPSAGCQTDPFDGEVIIIKHEADKEVQTDPYKPKKTIPKLPDPLTVKKVKTDLVQIFSFEEEVKPFVQCLTQKAIAQASMEVHEEEELNNMQRYLKAYEQSRKAAAAAIEKIEQLERKKYKDQKAVLKKKLKAEKKQNKLRKKILCRGFAEYATWDITEGVLTELDQHGFFYDEVERSIETEFLPWLSENVLEGKADIDSVLKAEMFQAVSLKEKSKVDELLSTFQVERDSQGEKYQKQKRRMIKEDQVAQAFRLKEKMELEKKKLETESEEEDGETNAERNPPESSTDVSYEESSNK